MNTEKKIKLTDKQKSIIAQIKIHGKYKAKNAQNSSVQKLVILGICEWHSSFDYLILTELGKTIEL